MSLTVFEVESGVRINSVGNPLFVKAGKRLFVKNNFLCIPSPNNICLLKLGRKKLGLKVAIPSLEGSIFNVCLNSYNIFLVLGDSDSTLLKSAKYDFKIESEKQLKGLDKIKFVNSTEIVGIVRDLAHSCSDRVTFFSEKWNKCETWSILRVECNELATGIDLPQERAICEIFRTNQRIMDFRCSLEQTDTKGISILLLDCTIYYLKYSIDRDDRMYNVGQLEHQIIIRPEQFNPLINLLRGIRKNLKHLKTIEYVEADQKVDRTRDRVLISRKTTRPAKPSPKTPI